MGRFPRCLLILLALCAQSLSHSQFSVTVCQDQDDALIATDRNDWAHNNLPIVNEGYLHNFDPPEPPCGLDNLSLISAEISIELSSYNATSDCQNVPVFGNVLLNCPLTTNSICGIVQDVLTPGCDFGAGQTNVGTYTLDLSTCGIFPSATDVIGVDLIPATENWDPCTTTDSAISDGMIDLTYEICITYNYFEDLPLACENTIALPCDDGDECTINDQEIVDECDNDIICVPCAGTLQADCTDTVMLPCDDGNPCTFNDEMEVSACDESFVCQACAGELIVDCDNTVTVPCDDGDQCTVGDVEVVSACDPDFICIPCSGVQAESCEITMELPCDDGNSCTENDVEVVDACNNAIICVPCAGTLQVDCSNTIVLPCDDGNPCTFNDEMEVAVCDESFVCQECAGELIADCDNTLTLPCDDGDQCTVGDVEVVSACDPNFVCIPCSGVPAGSCEVTMELPCNDGDPCTENDVEIVDACNADVICVPCSGTPVLPEVCNDGDCTNGIEFWDSESCTCQTEPVVLGCMDPESCNYDSLATCDSECDYNCIDCMGIPDGFATIDLCGECLLPEDPERDITCLDQLFVPNSFTPDNDGLNDVFEIGTSREFDFFQIRIYNRFGQEIFYSEDPHFQWVGNVKEGHHYVNSEVFAYKISFSYEFPVIREYSGTVTAVR